MNLIDHIDRVTFQISDRCPRAGEHPECPASLCVSKAPQNMPSALVHHALEALGRHSYDGAVAFHSFSEPLADPHLFFYIEAVKRQCPNCHILLYTGGWNLDESLLRDLEYAGVDTLNITAYCESEHKRLAGLVFAVRRPRIRLKHAAWVPLLDQYDREPIEHLRRCYAPLADICITTRGWIGLCCRDWEHRFDLIDLSQTPFEEAMRDERGRLRALYGELARGIRSRPICQRCDHARWWNAWRGPAPTPEELDSA